MKPFFPWRLFWKFFFNQLIVLLSLFFFVFGLIFYNLEIKVSFFVIGFFWSGFIVVAVGISIYMAYTLAMPLRSVIVQALRIANKKKVESSVGNQESELEMLTEEEGEYYEIERALKTIKRKLSKRKSQLAYEREESKALMSSLEDAVVSVDLNDHLKFFNSKFAVQFLQRHQILPEATVFLPDVFRSPELLDLFSIRSKKVRRRQIRLNVQGESVPRYFSITVSPLIEEQSQELYGVLGLFHDITDLKRVDQSRIEFIENASHELRTPLTSIKGFVETMKEDVQAQKWDQVPFFLSTISKSVNRLTELVNDMLSLSALESGSIIKKEWINLFQLTHEVVDSLSTMAKEKNIQIVVSVEVTELNADEKKVEQILENLVNNAIKYIQENGKIEILWKEDRENIELIVKDNGPGIGPEHLEFLFERFYRVDKGRSREAGGTGLGLAIVKHIMQNHGGQVRVSSELGHGACFICSFPKK